jgi:hypothetical protein
MKCVLYLVPRAWFEKTRNQEPSLESLEHLNHSSGGLDFQETGHKHCIVLRGNLVILEEQGEGG